jgi:Tfp pilus assembly protein PilO
MDLSQINIRNPKVIKIASTAFLAIVVIVLWYMQSFSPNKAEIEKKTADLEALKTKIQSAKMSATRVEEIRGELRRLFAQYKLIEEILPRERNVPDFINKITLSSKQADAALVRLEQQPSIPKGYYLADPYAITMNTTFNGLGKFLSLVANMPFTALVQDVKLNANVSQKYSITVSLVINAHHMEQATRLESIEEVLQKASGLPTTPAPAKQPAAGGAPDKKEIPKGAKEPS